MKLLPILIGMLLVPLSTIAAEWQWSVPMGRGRAFLWIPPSCERVRAVIVGQNNMLEEGTFEHPSMRRTLAQLGMAEVFIVPQVDNVFRFDQGASAQFAAMLRSLGEVSGYGELAIAPVIPIGHSACASYPWNFAADNPARTLAILSIKGDAPQTNLTGSGKPNPNWGTRSIDGIPALMVMSEYEWWDARLDPAVAFRARHPAAPIAVLADVGHCHFDARDSLVEFLAMFIRKAAQARLPAVQPALGTSGDSDTPPTLRPVDPTQGWLVDRWRRDEPRRVVAAPFATYTGDRAEAFWCFDEEMARVTEAQYANGRGKRPQQVDFVQDGAVSPISSTHAGVMLKFEPEPDGVTFHLGATYIRPLPPKSPVAAKDKPPAVTVVTPELASETEHARATPRILRITGPVQRLSDDTFRVAFNRASSTANLWSGDIWLLAEGAGDSTFKNAVQQAVLKLPRNEAGEEQVITFPSIPDQKLGATSVPLQATSSRGAPVAYFVREGPAEVDGDRLIFTALPPRTKFPVKITVVAWQFGRHAEPKLKAAQAVERTFSIVR